MKAERYVIIEVTMKRKYMVKQTGQNQTEINGMTPKQIIDDWFSGDVPMDHYHATRDSHAVSGSTRVIRAQVVKKRV